MRKMMLVLLAVVMCAALAGCAKPPSPEEQAAADYGPYPENYEQIIKDAMVSKLFDPYSAQYHFQGSPQQRFLSRPPIRGGGVTYGWGGTVLVNAKNRMGAYVGAQPHYYLIRYGQLVEFEDASMVRTQ